MRVVSASVSARGKSSCIEAALGRPKLDGPLVANCRLAFLAVAAMLIGFMPVVVADDLEKAAIAAAGGGTPSSSKADAPSPVISARLDHIPADPAFFVVIRPNELFHTSRELRVMEDLLNLGNVYQHPVPLTQIEQITFVAQQKKRREASGTNKRLPILVDTGEALFDHVDFEPIGTSAVMTISADAKTGNAVAFLISLLGDFGGLQQASSFAVPFDRTTLPEEENPPLALPSGVLASPRLVARREASAENLRKVAEALNRYVEKHGGMPWASVDESGPQLLSWRVHLLPYLGYDKLYQKFDLDEPWDSEHNQKLLAEMPAEYAGPPRGEDAELGTQTAVFALLSESSSDQARDDSAEAKVLLIEARRNVPWTRSDDVRLDQNLATAEPPAGWHPGGVMICDSTGHTHFVLDAQVADLLAGRAALAAQTDSETSGP